MKWQMFIGHGVLVASALLTIGVTRGLRKFRAIRRRRSPLHGKSIGNMPGQQLLERIEDESFEASQGIDLMLLALPMLFLIWTTLRIDWSHIHIGGTELLFVIGWLVFFAFGGWKYHRHARRVENARDGLLAERVTGMQLNRLLGKGCLVLHDLPCDVGNLDHVVIAPQGVFAIETKSFRKPKGEGENHRVRFDGRALHFPDFSSCKPIQQAKDNAQWLARYLHDKLGHEVPVTAAVSLPGWFIDRTDESKASPVRVFTPMGRGAEFLAHPPERIGPDQRAVIAQLLAANYPEATE